MVGVNVCDNLRVYLDVPYLVLSVIWVGGGGVRGGGGGAGRWCTWRDLCYVCFDLPDPVRSMVGG